MHGSAPSSHLIGKFVKQHLVMIWQEYHFLARWLRRYGKTDVCSVDDWMFKTVCALTNMTHNWDSSALGGSTLNSLDLERGTILACTSCRFQGLTLIPQGHFVDESILWTKMSMSHMHLFFLKQIVHCRDANDFHFLENSLEANVHTMYCDICGSLMFYLTPLPHKAKIQNKSHGHTSGCSHRM